MLTLQQRVAGLSPEVAQRVAAISQALEQGRIEEAERSMSAVLAQAPRHPEVLSLHGAIQGMRGRSQEAIVTLVESLKLRAKDARTLHSLAGAYEANWDTANALAAARLVVEMGSEWPTGWFNFGRLLLFNGHLDPAITALKRAVVMAPQHAPARTMLATALNTDGRSPEAAAQYRDILSQSPAYGHAWWGLATLKPMPLDATDVAQMRKLLQRPDVGDNDRIPMGFALAHALEHLDDYPQALAALQAANSLQRTPFFDTVRGHPVRKRPAHAVGFVHEDVQHIRQFGGAFHLRMRSENLLGQGRTRSRQAGDEDDLAALIVTGIGMGPRKRPLHAVDMRLERIGSPWLTLALQ